jgi:glycerol-3-phosphate cytidylyltransferase-like family protein
MECPHCNEDLRDAINYENREDHVMHCTMCSEVIHVHYDSYTEDFDDEIGVDIFTLHKPPYTSKDMG